MRHLSLKDISRILQIFHNLCRQTCFCNRPIASITNLSRVDIGTRKSVIALWEMMLILMNYYFYCHIERKNALRKRQLLKSDWLMYFVTEIRLFIHMLLFIWFSSDDSLLLESSGPPADLNQWEICFWQSAGKQRRQSTNQSIARYNCLIS